MSNRSKRRMTLTPDEENRLFNSYGRTCVGCGRPGYLEIDHVRSVADGGEDSFQNAQPLCPRCNVYKGDRSLDLRGWRGAAPFQLYRRVFWRPGRRRIKWGVLVRLLVRPVLIVMLALALLFLVTPLEDVIRSTLRAWWQDMRWYAYVGAAGWLLWWIAGKRDDCKLVYPDQYGQVPYFKGELRKHPEHAEQRNLTHQRYQIIRANHYMGEKVSIRMDQSKSSPSLTLLPLVSQRTNGSPISSPTTRTKCFLVVRAAGKARLPVHCWLLVPKQTRS